MTPPSTGKSALPGRIFSFVFVTAVASSCGAPNVPPKTANVARICDLQCKRLSDCRPGWDMDACERNCHSITLIPYYRDDYVESLVRCLDTSTCDVILSSLVSTCWRGSQPPPSDLAQRTCMAVAAKDRLCTGAAETSDMCIDKWGWGRLSDPVLAELEKCQDLGCRSNWRRHCAAEALGKDDR